MYYKSLIATKPICLISKQSMQWIYENALFTEHTHKLLYKYVCL